MNDMLATEATPTPAAPAAEHPYLETWSRNERMRHVPTIAWLAHKLDGDVRHRAEKLLAAYSTAPHDHPLHAQIDECFKALCRALDRLAEIARHHRNGHPPAELGHRLSWSISHAVSNLNTIDASTFGRRFPVQTFERSKAEPLYAAFLVVLQQVEKLVPLARAIDPNLDEKLLEGLVVLANPVDERMLKPIVA
jgi:hypothetical protein